MARNGPAFEAIVMRNHAADTHFSFLQGGPGAEYFRWKVSNRDNNDDTLVHLSGHEISDTMSSFMLSIWLSLSGMLSSLGAAQTCQV